MKVTDVEIHPSGSSAVAVLSYRDPARQNPYNVKNIAGLDVDEVVSQFYGVTEDLIYPADEGGGGPGGSNKLYSLSINKRVLVIRIGLNPDFALNKTYSDLRDDIYRVIAASRYGAITVHFKNGLQTPAVISGFVTKMEASLFSREPEVQLTVNCNQDPMLKSLARVDVPTAGISTGLIVVNDELSTAPHGFTARIECIADFPTCYIGDGDPALTPFAVSPIGGFVDGDILYISSEEGNKYLYVMSPGQINLADTIPLNAVWPMLFPGETTMGVYSDYFKWNTFQYYNTYWGI